jgi:hypothetical protein
MENIMKTISAFYLLIVLLSIFLFAQENSLIEKRLTMLREKLELTDDQTANIKQILLDAEKQAEQDRDLNKGNPRALIAAARERREMTDRQIENMLTEVQKIKYQELRKNIITDDRTSMLVERLKLSDEQALQVQTILIREQEQMEKLRNSSSDRKEKFSEMRSIREDTDKQIEQLLTEEQKKEYEQLIEGRQEQMKEQRGKRGRKGFQGY